MVKVTAHARERMKERCGVPKSSATRIAEKAWHSGLKWEDITGSVKTWVNGQWKGKKCSYRIFQEKLYVFSLSGVLITVIPIPGNLHQSIKRMEGKRGSKD